MDTTTDTTLLADEFAVSPPSDPKPRQPPKSPPLAFAPTSNDSLAPLILSPQPHSQFGSLASLPRARSIADTMSPPHTTQEVDLQAIVHQQANAMHLSHEAFAAERLVWKLERERLYQRIGSLEKLLRSGDHYSPAKSPVLSPTSGSIASVQSRAASNASRLPIIEEDENTQPLSARRDGAPRSIDLPGRPPVPNPRVSFSHSDELKVDDVPLSPPGSPKALSPLPPHNLVMAGHTPLKAPRAPTPPPQNMLDGIDDTPTRRNTHINNFLTQSDKDEEEEVLKGPLNLPELPNKPDHTNFTLEALSRRLEQIEHDPEDSGRPTVLSRPVSGYESPAETAAESRLDEATLAPQVSRRGDRSGSRMGSSLISPLTTLSPHGGLPTEQQASEEKVQQSFENGGIKLKKKPSTNFGAPFGSLGGFGGMRKTS